MNGKTCRELVRSRTDELCGELGLYEARRRALAEAAEAAINDISDVHIRTALGVLFHLVRRPK